MSLRVILTPQLSNNSTNPHLFKINMTLLEHHRSWWHLKWKTFKDITSQFILSCLSEAEHWKFIMPLLCDRLPKSDVIKFSTEFQKESLTLQRKCIIKLVYHKIISAAFSHSILFEFRSEKIHLSQNMTMYSAVSVTLIVAAIIQQRP